MGLTGLTTSVPSPLRNRILPARTGGGAGTAGGAPIGVIGVATLAAAKLAPTVAGAAVAVAVPVANPVPAGAGIATGTAAVASVGWLVPLFGLLWCLGHLPRPSSVSLEVG